MDLLILLVLTNFIRTIFIIVIIYYGIRLFTRYILPMLVDKGLKNMQQKMQDQQRQSQRSTRPPGEVTIEYNNRTGKNNSQTRGDYVDFEEVE
ncbi:MAG TPA: DUF4834 family protein [Draconibacterium sp.]|nr:DUF4834 family protein [Draconibacterium sp.]